MLVLDEPTAGLDPKQIIETRQLIRELAGTHTIVLSTHILPEVAQTCQKVVIINKGKVVAIDTPEALTERLRGAVTMYRAGAGTRRATCSAALQSIAGVVRVNVAEIADDIGNFDVDTEKGADVRREVATAIVRGGWGLLELRPMRDEPRGHLPQPDDGRDRDREDRAPRKRRWPMRNVDGHRPARGERLLLASDRLRR